MKVLMWPSLKKTEGDESGIVRVIEAYTKRMTERGYEFVEKMEQPHDISVGHAGTLVGGDVVHCHGLYWTADYPASSWEWHINKNVVEACRRAKVITVPSNWVAETFRREMRINPVVIPHGLDWWDWEPKEHGGYVLWNKNRTGDVCDPEPAGFLAEAYPDLDFVMTFPPKRKHPNIKAIGKVAHNIMKDWIENAGVYLATTKETFGIGILEAMAAGVPVLGFDHGGIKDLIVHGETGYLAKVNDLGDLKNGLQYCFVNREVLGANAREAIKEFAWDKAIDLVEEVYQKAATIDDPDVSVIIPCYNYADKAERAIRSVMSQTYDHLKNIIIVDDGSDDSKDLEKIVKQLKKEDDRIHYVWQENQGVAKARNRGISEVSTKYVMCLDADDKVDPEYLSKVLPTLEEDRSFGIAFSGLQWIKPDGSTGVSQWPEGWDYDRQLRRQNQIPTCCVFRKDMWERLGGYRQRYAPKGAGSEDAEFWTRSGAYGWQAVQATKEPLFVYSWLSGGVTGDPDYREVDWLAWHPWAHDAQHPFASYATPDHISHPVRQYDLPLVSVIIPVGPTHDKHLVDALDSLEAQTFRNWQAIVVWDRDDMIPDYYKTAYPYVKWIEVGMNEGAGAARNHGARFADAPFLVFLDADDWLYPEALRLMIETWNTDDAIIYTDYVGKAIVDNPKKLAPELQEHLYSYDEKTQDAIIGYRSANYDPKRAQAQPEEPQPFIWCLITALIPKLWHDEIGGFDERMHSWEDVDYHYRMAKAGKCYVRIPEELMVVRFHTGTRRDTGYKDRQELIGYLKNKYEEIEIVGCNCGGRKVSTTTTRMRPMSAPRTATNVPRLGRNGRMQEETMSDVDFVMVQYVHPNKGKHKVVGMATRTDYGRRSGGERFLVHREDAAAQAHLFIELETRPVPTAERETPIPSPMRKLQEEPQSISPPTKLEIGSEPDNGEFDLNLLPGATPDIVEGLKEAGLASVDAIREAGEDGLKLVKGIGPARATRILGAIEALLAQ